MNAKNTTTTPTNGQEGEEWIVSTSAACTLSVIPLQTKGKLAKLYCKMIPLVTDDTTKILLLIFLLIVMCLIYLNNNLVVCLGNNRKNHIKIEMWLGKNVEDRRKEQNQISKNKQIGQDGCLNINVSLSKGSNC